MGQPGRDPGRLLRREQVVGSRGLELGHSLEGVFDLVQVVAMPACDEVAAFVQEGPRPDRRPTSPVDPRVDPQVDPQVDLRELGR